MIYHTGMWRVGRLCHPTARLIHVGNGEKCLKYSQLILDLAYNDKDTLY